MSLQDTVLPLLTRDNAPADFAMVSNRQDAREAYRDPRYSHVFLMLPPDPEAEAYINTLQAMTLERATNPTHYRSASPFSELGGSMISSSVRAYEGRLNTEELKDTLPNGQGREAFIERNATVVSNFAAVIRGNTDSSGNTLSNHNLDILRPQDKQDEAHQDSTPVSVMTEFGPGTPVASLALARQRLEEGEPNARRAVMEGVLLTTTHGAAFSMRPALSRIASYMFMAPPGVQVMLKPKLQSDAHAPADYKPSTHAFPWATRNVPSQQDLRMRILMS